MTSNKNTFYKHVFFKFFIISFGNEREKRKQSSQRRIADSPSIFFFSSSFSHRVIPIAPRSFFPRFGSVVLRNSRWRSTEHRTRDCTGGGGGGGLKMAGTQREGPRSENKPNYKGILRSARCRALVWRNNEPPAFS